LVEALAQKEGREIWKLPQSRVLAQKRRIREQETAPMGVLGAKKKDKRAGNCANEFSWRKKNDKKLHPPLCAIF
jgi:hypothetical protein